MLPWSAQLIVVGTSCQSNSALRKTRLCLQMDCVVVLFEVWKHHPPSLQEPIYCSKEEFFLCKIDSVISDSWNHDSVSSGWTTSIFISLIFSCSTWKSKAATLSCSSLDTMNNFLFCLEVADEYIWWKFKSHVLIICSSLSWILYKHFVLIQAAAAFKRMILSQAEGRLPFLSIFQTCNIVMCLKSKNKQQIKEIGIRN